MNITKSVESRVSYPLYVESIWHLGYVGVGMVRGSGSRATVVDGLFALTPVGDNPGRIKITALRGRNAGIYSLRPVGNTVQKRTVYLTGSARVVVDGESYKVSELFD